MTIVTIEECGLRVSIRLPQGVTEAAYRAAMSAAGASLESASVKFSTGALLAHRPAPLVYGPPKGTGAGAKSAPVRLLTGAPVAPAPSRVGPRSAKIEDRISYYRSELKALTQAKAELTPAFDQHTNALKAARDTLKISHETHQVFAGDVVRDHRLKLHDSILDASNRWGKQARQYRDTTAMMKVMTGEIERLEASAGRTR